MSPKPPVSVEPAPSAPPAAMQWPVPVSPGFEPPTQVPDPMASFNVPPNGAMGAWIMDLEREARTLLESGRPEVWDALTRQFEACLIHTALEITRGRRIEAAQKLGIGRNTITRKIQELGLDD